MEGQSMDLGRIAGSLLDVARPTTAEKYFSGLMNSSQSISHLLREPPLAKRLDIPPDFLLQVLRSRDAAFFIKTMFASYIH